MNPIWARLLSVDPARLAGAEHVELSWARLAGGGDLAFWSAAGALAVAVGLRAVYARDAREVSRARRTTLLLLRLVALAALATMLLEPELVVERRSSEPRTLLVLADGSSSMDLADAWPADDASRALAESLGVDPNAPPTRAALVVRVLDDAARDRLAQGGERVVRVRAFGDGLAPGELPTGTEAGAALTALQRESTALGSALEQALAAERGRPLAGVLVVGDGRSNAGPDAAQVAARAGCVVHALAVGREERAGARRLAGLEHDPLALSGDPFEVVALVEGGGSGEGEVDLVLEARRAGGAWTERGRARLTADEGGGPARTPFVLQEDGEGELLLRARLVEPAAEDVGVAQVAQEAAQGVVQVVRARLRVLLVAGQAFPEVQFLQNALLRDPQVELASWLQGAEEGYRQKGDAPLEHPPSTAEELAPYDCVVLVDPRWEELPRDFGRWLADLVADEGGGLVFVAGEGGTEALFDRTVPQAEALLELLPVAREPDVYRTQTERRALALETWSLDVTDAGRAGLLRFLQDARENDALLDALPGMYWHFPVTREKPGAMVLARNADPRMQNRYGAHVVIATQLFGAGRATFLACDSTYRWRYLGEELFDGFWSRAIGEAGRGKLLGAREPLVLASDRARYRPGAVATLRARFRDAPPAPPASLFARVAHGDDAPLELALLPVAGEPAAYEARLDLAQPGEYVWTAWPGADPRGAAHDGGGRALQPSRARLVVDAVSLEHAQPGLDRASLARVCAAAGGRVFDLEERDALADAFPREPFERRTRERLELWHAPLFAGACLLSLFLEWALRKRSGLA